MIDAPVPASVTITQLVTMENIKAMELDTLRLPLRCLAALVISCGLLTGIVLAADSQPSAAIAAINNLAAIISAFALLIGAVGVAWSKINTKIDVVHKAIESTAKAVDGQMEHFKEQVAAAGRLEATVARLEGAKAGYEAGQLKAEGMADKQADAVAVARELPSSTDKKGETS